MPKRTLKIPEDAIRITKYAEFTEFVRAFVKGSFPLLIIVGSPGLSKSASLKKGVRKKRALVLKGRKTPIDFYCDLFWHLGEPIILDDADSLLGTPLNAEYVKALTESEEFSELRWGSSTKILEKNCVPDVFHSNSKVCIITNWWDPDDPTFHALESRGEFVHFDPPWDEVYRHASQWFWDQEILDYAYDRLDVMRSPDCRILVKAYNRKKAGMKVARWQAVIDHYCDDTLGLKVRQLMDDRSFPSNSARAKAFIDLTGASRPTFYRRMDEIRRHRPSNGVRRLKAKGTPPQASGSV